MTTQPVLLLTFSNDAGDYLPMIVAEQKAIKRALLDYGDKNYLEVRDVQHASTEEIFYLVNRYHQRLCIFHYGGHADQESLQLEQEIGVVQTANVQGIAGLLGTQQQLKLVFLNGCATKGQVKVLLDSGVPAVIATRVAIQDQEAQKFSGQFYEALSTGSTIREAFQKAKALIETFRKDLLIQDIETTRGIKLNKETDNELPWGLYFREEKEEVLDWKLPTHSAFEIDFGDDQWKRRKESAVNELLVDTSLKAIRESEFIKELARKIHKERRAGNTSRKPTDAEKKDAIIRAYPAPISVHLRALFSKKLSENYSEERLQQLVNTYQTSLKLLSFILLSDVWDASHKQSTGLDILESERLQLQAFFNLNSFTIHTFDYFLLIDALLKIANRNGLKLYVDDLMQYKNGWSENEILAGVNQHFQRMRTELESDIPSKHIEAYSMEAEQQLGHLLEELHYLALYKMAVVKNIEVQQLKNTPPRAFKHIIVELDNNYHDVGEKDRQQELEDATDMESILLYQEQLGKSLNLSPFMLDENALIREYNSKMYFFSHSNEEGLHYYWIENEQDKLVVSERQFAQVLRQFESARAAILDEKVKRETATEVDDDDILSVI